MEINKLLSTLVFCYYLQDNRKYILDEYKSDTNSDFGINEIKRLKYGNSFIGEISKHRTAYIYETLDQCLKIASNTKEQNCP